MDLVFNHRIDLQRGNIFPYQVPPDVENSDYLAKLTRYQQQLMERAQFWQTMQNEKRLSKEDRRKPKTVFPPNSYVLAKAETGPTDKLSPPWLGPFIIEQREDRREGDVYTCRHLGTQEVFTYRIDRLKPFYFESEADLLRASLLDDHQFEIEAIMDHRFSSSNDSQSEKTTSNSKKRRKDAPQLELKVKWLGYDEPTWEPFKGTDSSLESVGLVHEYLRRHKMSDRIPQRFR